MKHFIKRAKTFFKHVGQKFVVKDEKTGKVKLKTEALAILIVLAITVPVLIVYLYSTKNISSIERKALMNKSDEVINYIDYLDVDKLTNDNYILFTLKYSYYHDNKGIISSNDISEKINSRFNANVTAEQVKNNGISQLLVDENVTYSTTNDTYELNMVKVSASKIAETPVSYYKVKKVSKINKKKYEIVYQKYIIDNPYNVLNYYIDQNAQTDNFVDINPYRNYLVGSDSVYRFRESIIPEDIEKYGKADKKIKITYVVKDDNILIDKVGTCKLC